MTFSNHCLLVGGWFSVKNNVDLQDREILEYLSNKIFILDLFLYRTHQNKYYKLLAVFCKELFLL